MSEQTLDLAKWRSELIKQHNELADCPRLTREEYSHAKMLQRWISQLTAAQGRVNELEHIADIAERQLKSFATTIGEEVDKLTSDNARLTERVAELEPQLSVCKCLLTEWMDVPSANSVSTSWLRDKTRALLSGDDNAQDR